MIGETGPVASQYVVEHLNYLGIVAEVCREIGVAEWLDQQEPSNRQQVSVGTATVALVLNGLGFSNRRLYLVSQYFADKPVEHLLRPGIRAEDLNDDCLGRTLDWLYARCHATVCGAGAAGAARVRGRGGVAAYRHHLVFGPWPVCRRDGGRVRDGRTGRRQGELRRRGGGPCGRRGERARRHRSDLRLFTRPS